MHRRGRARRNGIRARPFQRQARVESGPSGQPPRRGIARQFSAARRITRRRCLRWQPIAPRAFLHGRQHPALPRHRRYLHRRRRHRRRRALPARVVRARLPRNGPEARAAYLDRRFRTCGGKSSMNRHSGATHPARAGASAVLVLVTAFALFAAFRPQAHAAQEAPRTVRYLHGRIYTNDPQHPWAQAMAIREGNILCIGSISQVMLECGGDANTETVELHEKFIMPGFNDAHVHLGYAGAGQGMLAVRLYGAASVEELKQRLAASVASHKPGEWITGGGWDHTLWPEKQFPNKWMLDDVASKNPVLLTHVSG